MTWGDISKQHNSYLLPVQINKCCTWTNMPWTASSFIALIWLPHFLWNWWHKIERIFRSRLRKWEEIIFSLTGALEGRREDIQNKKKKFIREPICASAFFIWLEFSAWPWWRWKWFESIYCSPMSPRQRPEWARGHRVRIITAPFRRHNAFWSDAHQQHRICKTEQIAEMGGGGRNIYCFIFQSYISFLFILYLNRQHVKGNQSGRVHTDP